MIRANAQQTAVKALLILAAKRCILASWTARRRSLIVRRRCMHYTVLSAEHEKAGMDFVEVGVLINNWIRSEKG